MTQRRQDRAAVNVVVSPDPSLVGQLGAVERQIVATPEAFGNAVDGWAPRAEVSWPAWTA